MSETCGVCKKQVEFTMTIEVEHNGKVFKPICMKCMRDLPEKLRKIKEKVNAQMAIKTRP